MRITPEHLTLIREAVTPLDTPERREGYRNREFPRAAAVKNLDKRYRWDLFYAATRVDLNALRPVLDAGYFDTHFDTALKAVVPAL